jgi:hypothetical protein
MRYCSGFQGIIIYKPIDESVYDESIEAELFCTGSAIIIIGLSLIMSYR